jgi:hypothetical protein
MFENILTGVVSGLIGAGLIIIFQQIWKWRNLNKKGLRVYMLRRNRSVEAHNIPLDSKTFFWKGGHYRVRENAIKNSIKMGETPKLDGLEIIFTEGNPEPLK